ncbi:hypothetical protein QBZ16_001388 [Prototheca wickerhamii]|uniref:Peptidase C1A papain C-terminal domain-containing protein n=1 Tax=Prototheca wickerhamii TaxID=3111 RepID=A0AAD9MGZ3_PROWI|nr:hypothetical protein QBZ16_001388 [Prototheca wickerhamii]
MSRAFVRAVLVACVLVAGVSAGCKKRNRPVSDEEAFYNHQPLLSTLDLASLPKNFDWNDKDGKSYLAPSWNQHIPTYCGSCWLHGTASMLQDRLKITKDAAGPDVMLARQVVLNCAAFHGMGGGCDGGDVIDVLHYMAKFGLPDESCQPYAATDHTKYGKHAKSCPPEGYCMNCMPVKGKDTCWPVKTPIRYYVESFGRIGEPGELPMMNEIYARGPLTCSIATPTVFDYGYHAGVFHDKDNSTDVDHDVEVVGWGEEADGQKYWVVRNSWGTYFGNLGFFKLERGVNSLQIESGDCWFATVSWKDEQDIRSGAKVGTMWGIMTKEEAAHVKPEEGVRPHFDKEDGEAVAAVRKHGHRHARPIKFVDTA